MLTRRNLTLVILFFIIWIVLTLVLPTFRASASPLTIGGLVVTRLDDPAPNGCQVGDCSLREAVIAANVLTDTDTITFAVNGTVELSIAGAGEDNAQTGDLDIKAPVTIQGVHHTLTAIDSNGLDRVFDIYGIATTNAVTITALTIEGGVVTGADGGGVRIASQSNVTVRGVTIRNNHADNGGGIATHGALYLAQSAILQNEAEEAAGILTRYGISVVNTTISSNRLGDVGAIGGILHIADGTPLQNVSLNSVTATANEGAQVGTLGINGGGARTYLRNTIVDGTFSGFACSTQSTSGSSAETYSSGYNIATTSSCNLGNPTDLPNTDPKLTNLNGTVHYPNYDSPALDSGDTALPIDQLGSNRPFDLPGIPNTTDGDDRGAVEFSFPIFTVTRLDDPTPNGCQMGDCSLREALQAADTPDINMVTFAVSGTFEVALGVLPIHGSTILQGAGSANTIIDANGLSAVLGVQESSNNPAPWCMPTIRDVTITGGTESGMWVEGDCTFSLYDSVVRNNSSPVGGGGIYYLGPAALLATISNSAIISNTAPNGGGLYLVNTFLDISNSTISGNSATNTGGGLYYASATSGSLSAQLNSVTFANNSAAIGDAIAFEESAPPQNTTVTLSNSIFAGSAGSACATIGFDTLTFTSAGYNLADDLSCNLTQPTDLPNTNPQLPPLRLDSGTYVHVPTLNSPALDSGSAGGLTTDQRSLPRPVDLSGIPNPNDGADRGAYEHQNVPPTAVVLSTFSGQREPISPFTFLALGAVAIGIALWRYRRR